MSTQEVLDQIDAAVHDWEVGPDAMRVGGPDPVDQPVGPGVLARPFAEFGRQMTRAFNRSIKPLARTLHQLGVALLATPQRRRHISRCRSCNPRANPRPLCIDGHAYHRRTKARRRRR